jgi:hypothetical protein
MKLFALKETAQDMYRCGDSVQKAIVAQSVKLAQINV